MLLQWLNKCGCITKYRSVFMITHGLGDLFRLTNFERGGKSSWPCALKCLSPLLNFILWEKPTRCNNLFISLNAIPHQQRCTSGEKNYIFSKQKRVFVFFFYCRAWVLSASQINFVQVNCSEKKKKSSEGERSWLAPASRRLSRWAGAQLVRPRLFFSRFLLPKP